MSAAPSLPSGIARTQERTRPPPTPNASTVGALLLMLGLAHLVLQPPFAAGDEREHMALLAELARFELASPSDAAGAHHQVDAKLGQLASASEQLTADWQARVSLASLLDDLRTGAGEQPTQRMARTTPPSFGRLADLPLLPGYWLGRALGLSPLAQLYLARLAGLASFALLAGHAVSNAGPLALALFALSALPGSLAQAASVSGEGMGNGLALCFFALLGRGWLERERGLAERERSALLAMLLALAACRPCFACAALFLPALPDHETVRPLLRGRRLIALGAASAAIGVLIWLRTNPPPAGAGGAAFLRAHPLATLLGLAASLIQIDSLVISLCAFGGALVDQARFSAGAIAALGGELLLLLAWGAARHTPGGPASGGGRRWLAAGALVYALASALWLQLTQTSAGPLVLDTLSARSFALIAPAALLLLSTLGRPGLLRYLSARPATRVGLPLVLLNALALSALLGRYFAPASWSWPY